MIVNVPQLVFGLIAIGLAITFNPWWLLLLAIHIQSPEKKE